MDLVVTARVKASSDLAFKALTHPDGLNQFWTEKSEIEGREGGRFALWYEDADAEEPDAEGEFEAFEPGTKVIMRFGIGDPHPVIVTFSGDPRGNTDIVLTHANLDEDDEEALEELYDGWEEVLAGVKQVAERWAAKAAKAAKESEGTRSRKAKPKGRR